MSGTDKTRFTSARIIAFIVGNVLVFTAFSVLWVEEYHMAGDLPDRIDEIVVPWLWLLCFFTASLLPLRPPTVRAIPVAALSALILSAALFFFINFLLVPLFDPMF